MTYLSKYISVYPSANDYNYWIQTVENFYKKNP